MKHIRSGSVAEREPYSLHFINEETTAVHGLMNSTVFEDFPDLKIICSHGGGAVPYQLGRFEAGSARGKRGLFSERMRKMYFDTVLYTQDAIELLIKAVGVDQCLFGAECPGVGSVVHPHTGKTFDDVAPSIKAIEWLSDADKDKILSGNAIKLFKLEDAVKVSKAAE